MSQHPNKLPFTGCLTLVDTPSDRAPAGARGHRVIVTREAVEASLHELEGLAVNFSPGLDHHDRKNKCGIITSADLFGKELRVTGHLYVLDFPEIERDKQFKQPLGMSYELHDAHVWDMRAQVWTLHKITFQGAAFGRRDKFAYRKTWFRIGDNQITRKRRKKEVQITAGEG